MAKSRDPVALVIDCGSNSIKGLLAGKSTSNEIEVLWERTIETRLSGGLHDENADMPDTTIEAGILTIQTLLEEARKVALPSMERVIATAALRKATNRDRFLEKLEARTGTRLEIISGEREAFYIAKGVATDPHLPKKETSFSILDLGGGSLECIAYRGGIIEERKSFPLGAVRLMESFLEDPNGPLYPEVQERIAQHCRETLSEFLQPFPSRLVATGGAFAVTRMLIKDAVITRSSIKTLLGRWASHTLAERLDMGELPPARADILPVAWVIMDTALEILGTESCLHSFHNLRFGIASEILWGA